MAIPASSSADGQLARQTSDQALGILTGALSEGGGSTADFTTARGLLANAIRDEKNALVDIVSSHASQIARHLSRGEELAANASRVHRSLTTVEQDFNVDNPKSLVVLSQFLALSADRHVSGSDVSEAEAKTAVLKDITRRYQALIDAENAVWSGRGADESTMALLKDLPTSGITASKVESAISARFDLLRTLVSDQLGLAWNEAIIFGDARGRPALSVKPSVELQPPRSSRSTPASDELLGPASYTVTDIGQALAQLGTLPSLLQELHGRIIRNAIEHLVTDGNVSAEEQVDEAGKQMLVIAPVSKQDPIGVVSNVRLAMAFVARTMLPSSLLEGRDAFLSSLQQGSFQLLLDRVLLPAMPLELEHVPEWLQLVRQSAEWEQELGTEASGKGVLGALPPFLQTGAGQAWLDQRREQTLRQTRRLIYDDWKSWRSKPVDDLFDLGIQEATPPQAHQGKETEPPLQEDDGWGFDESQVGATDDDGWNFDDFDAVPSQPALPVKPVREAKRLGKKVGHKLPQSEMPAQDEVTDVPTLPHVVVPAVPPLAEASADRKSYQVSDICDRVIDIAASAIKDFEVIASIRSTEPAFSNVSDGLSQQLSQALDMIRAATPVVYSARLQSTPAIAMQLSNDFQYIANRLATCEATVPWAARSTTVDRFTLGAKFVYDACIEEQVAMNSALINSADFASCSNDGAFTATSAVVEELVSRINTLGAAIFPVVGSQRYNTALGRVIESVTDILLDRILGLEDITEIESERLGTLLSQVEKVDRLFTSSSGSMSSIAAFVPRWLKLCYTNQLLGANLADITYLFETGSLVDFGTDELSRLVRALFADSPKRTSLLEKMERRDGA